ncbi:hypothetical protein PYCCODRAFT_779329 [Trametes coccinea BRFM310]|uniref:Uncharacterized protein n=1 Tax=Trametes coccinea (strain BRFM310) TaxID=1353009 RepID=A0A1Y2J0H8_TRAC3|nr:hypothetical protein PYCCODRAFT_779329 [Trametes coccinea BRFM310]
MLSISLAVSVARTCPLTRTTLTRLLFSYGTWAVRGVIQSLFFALLSILGDLPADEYSTVDGHAHRATALATTTLRSPYTAADAHVLPDILEGSLDTSLSADEKSLSVLCHVPDLVNFTGGTKVFRGVQGARIRSF